MSKPLNSLMDTCLSTLGGLASHTLTRLILLFCLCSVYVITGVEKLLDIPKALVVYTRGSAYRENTPIPLSFDHQAPYIDFWLRMIGVRELRSVIVDNAWNLDDAESAASLAAGKQSVEEIARDFW